MLGPWRSAAVVHSGGPQVERRPGRVTNTRADYFGYVHRVVTAGHGIGHPSLEPVGDIVEDGRARRDTPLEPVAVHQVALDRRRPEEGLGDLQLVIGQHVDGD